MREELKQEIVEHAHEFPEEEVCGLVVQKDLVNFSTVRIKNIHPNKEDCFTIDPAEIIKHNKYGTIIGIYHSHPKTKASPSPYDGVNCEEIGIPYYIYSVKYDSFYCDIPMSFRPAPLFDRVYVEDIYNCLTFIKDYYILETNWLPSYEDRLEKKRQWSVHPAFQEHGFMERDDKRAASELVVNWIEKNDFFGTGKSTLSQVDAKDLQRHDLMIFKFFESSFYHFGVYIGNGQFVHHPIFQLPQKSSYERYQKQVYKIYRLSNLQGQG
jgi:proteasome lid subunit RPN8/RPN11|tara:strand:- start:937 stop:1740 length:804 start_codon:yes stop_codon:yes gene_type:complete